LKDPPVFLEHVLESIQFVREYTASITKEEFKASRQVQDAVIRRLEIIGEAVKNLPPDFRQAHGDVAWKSFAGLRDVLIHEYFGVDLDLTWTTVQDDLPNLEKQIIGILSRTK
jgi:uncharacterized protein with HEPN domain